MRTSELEQIEHIWPDQEKQVRDLLRRIAEAKRRQQP
ncbi:MAG: hypothetical protein OJF49_001900 [Ktedonobacterales bacterium]|nr:MAG: hypothetical protein OJF49_001900 [Ktedonobacterales bacterium]